MRRVRYRSVAALALAAGLAACGGDAAEEPVGEAEVAEAPVAETEAPVATEPAAPAAPAPNIAAADLPEGVTPEMVAQGRQLFATTCISCHGGEGVGGPLGPALNDPEWINISGNFDEILQTIHEGVATPTEFPAPMPPGGGVTLSDEQARSLAAYVYSISRAAE